MSFKVLLFLLTLCYIDILVCVLQYIEFIQKFWFSYIACLLDRLRKWDLLLLIVNGGEGGDH